MEQGARPLPDLEFIHEGDLNPYVYPEIADHTESRPLGPTWHRLDSSVRDTDEEFTLRAEIADRPDDSAPCLLTEETKHDLPLGRIAALTSWNPAWSYGLGSKGALAPGFDADIALVDAGRRTWTVRAAESESESERPRGTPRSRASS